MRELLIVTTSISSLKSKTIMLRESVLSFNQNEKKKNELIIFSRHHTTTYMYTYLQFMRNNQLFTACLMINAPRN